MGAGVIYGVMGNARIPNVKKKCANYMKCKGWIYRQFSIKRYCVQCVKSGYISGLREKGDGNGGETQD